ncbi:MAG: hypothetical protein ABIL09_06095 [Gemmatimonadota bacterium]
MPNEVAAMVTTRTCCRAVRRWLRRGAPAVLLLAARAAPAGADESTWTAESSREQLARDPLLIPKGKGMLFVPAMTVPLGNEPSYQVFQNDHAVDSQNPGRGMLLPPGYYDVLIGSGTPSQMTKYRVEVLEGSVTLMKPDWSALVVDVVDPSRASINESYELLQGDTGENFGPGYGIEEERGERVRTWLLPPGVYHVVRVGESFTTVRKFSVRLLPGQLTQRNLVYDADRGEFVGFYPRPAMLASLARTRRATSQTELSGSTTVNTSQRTAGDDRTSLNMAVQVFNRTRYSSDRNFLSLRLVFEEGATKEGGSAFRKSIDNFEVRGTYIRRLSRQFGPYLRGVLNTHLFPEDARFTTPTDFVMVDGTDTLATFPGASQVTLLPSFYPLILRQGAGINSQMIRTFPLNMDLRFGFGARQTLVSDAYRLNADGRSATRLSTQTSTGLEALLIMDARPARAMSFDSEFDLLINSTDTGNWVFSWENRLRVFLTSFINLDLVADVQREETLRRVQAKEQVLLRFSKFL